MVLDSFCSQKGAVGVKQPYIRVVGLEQSRDNNSNGPSNFTLDEVVSFSRFSLIRALYVPVRLIFLAGL
jgi:DNA replication licensing factor MCM5